MAEPVCRHPSCLGSSWLAGFPDVPLGFRKELEATGVVYQIPTARSNVEFFKILNGLGGNLDYFGCLSSSIHLSTTSDLLTTGYGRVLLLKIVLAVTVMGLGALNWTTLKSGLQTYCEFGATKTRKFQGDLVCAVGLVGHSTVDSVGSPGTPDS